MKNKSSEISIGQAARWYARLNAPDCTESERNAFKAWLSGSREREQAYRSVIDAANLMNGQLGSDPRIRAMAAEALHEPQAENSTRHGSRAAGFGARFRYAAAAAILAGMAIFVGVEKGQVLDVSPAELYVNNELSMRRIELSDGSVVYLDVGARLTVALSAKERRLDLETGRALFEVAHDKSRPFSVSKSSMRVVALGTRFQVEVEPSSETVNVTLVEGSVAVSSTAQANTWNEVLEPGQQLLVDNLLRRHQIVSVNANSATSWSTGRLVFDGMPLRKVLEEINRYSKDKILLGDSSLADIPVAGNFTAGRDSREFVETLTSVLPLKSSRTGAHEIVLFHNHETYDN